MTVQPLTPDEPRTIGRYRVLGVLGSGGMGRVLLGAGPDGRLLAIKQVHAHLLNQRGYRARFQREVSAGTRVSGAFTAPVVDFDVDGETPWLASVFVIGVPLNRAIEQYGPLPVPAVRALAAGLAVALADIHRAGLVHRDLKPANVLLTADGPRVIDFGIAYMTENPGGLTETGSTLGSPAFMSPEQTLGEPVTAASDMFSLGSVLATAASGNNPFQAASLAYTLFQIAHGAADLDAVPAELRSLIEPCLDKDPNHRPTPAQLLAWLGRQPEGPAPWPDTIRDAIERQEREFAGIASDPNATLVASRTSRSAGRSRAGGASGYRRKVTWLGVAALLAVVALVAGVLTWKHSQSSAQARPGADTTLSTLRAADVCAWVRQALSGSVPAGSGWDTDPGNWTMGSTYIWGCNARSGAQRMTVQAGETTAPIRDIVGKVDGFTLLGTEGSGNVGCDRAVDLAEDQQIWGITVNLANAPNCDFATHLIERLLATRATAPERSDTASLAGVDVCGVIPRTALDTAIGPLSQTPPVATAHSCHWEGSATLEVSMRAVDMASMRLDAGVELANGKTAFPQMSSLTSTCEFVYSHRTVADLQEIVDVRIDGAKGGREQYCDTVKSILNALIGQLPKAN
ncbi:serine/threonine-protein kinase [Nocardia sp. NPDC058058]|uniref:serine/threonine-protein kinase n=1 Tax=Nocardia sp. NPDC058058 TaxID=3346317 RepID=UPI0036D8282F